MKKTAAAPRIADQRRIVVKIGSALLVDATNAALRTKWLESVCADIAELRASGADIIVVSSGAISLARHRLGLTSRRLRLDEKQAMASVGQIGLAQGWSMALAEHGITAAQLLLTPDDTESRERHLNASDSSNSTRPRLRSGHQRERCNCHWRNSLRR